MNTSTKNLENDHVYILKLTDVMRAVTRSEKPDIKHIENIIDIIRNYADGLHHAKEEKKKDRALSDNEQKDLIEKFETLEESRPAGSRVNDYINRINALTLLYKV